MVDESAIVDQKGRPLIKSPDFRQIYSNSFRLRLGDNDCSLTLGIETDGPNGVIQIIDVVQVMLTPRTVKLLHLILDHGIKALETQIGEIPLAPNVREELEMRVKAAEDILAEQRATTHTPAFAKTGRKSQRSKKEK